MAITSRPILETSAFTSQASTKAGCRRTIAWTSTSSAPGKEVGGGELELSAGVTNVYSRENVFYINRITGQRKNQLPFLPSVGLDWSF